MQTVKPRQVSLTQRYRRSHGQEYWTKKYGFTNRGMWDVSRVIHDVTPTGVAVRSIHDKNIVYTLYIGWIQFFGRKVWVTSWGSPDKEWRPADWQTCNDLGEGILDVWAWNQNQYEFCICIPTAWKKGGYFKSSKPKRIKTGWYR